MTQMKLQLIHPDDPVWPPGLPRELDQALMLHVGGTLDGSGAWRLLRVCARLSRRRPVLVDLGGIERLMSFAAAVLGLKLQALPGVHVCHVRPEHRRQLRAAGVPRLLTGSRPLR